MVNGAVAQPVRTSICNAEKIPFSDAYGFGIFYYHGEESVMPDLTLTYGDSALDVAVSAGADATHTAVEMDMREGASLLLQSRCGRKRHHSCGWLEVHRYAGLLQVEWRG